MIKFELEIENIKYYIDTNFPLDISIGLNFNSSQPNTYGVEKASSREYRIDNFIGDTRQGGSCNFEVITFVPHCNGTHTECIGHITNERISINKTLENPFYLADLITVTPELGKDCSDNYIPDLNIDDLVISKKVIVSYLTSNKSSEALIIRTLPNNDYKKSIDYLNNLPPFISIDAMQYILSLGYKHLLVDFPSVDRTFDDGKLSSHRTFWKIDFGKFETNINSNKLNTITEMVYINNEIKDGKYLLLLQIAPFNSDASPSKPLLYQLNKIGENK